jgi:hypothetical protein
VNDVLVDAGASQPHLASGRQLPVLRLRNTDGQ